MSSQRDLDLRIRAWLEKRKLDSTHVRLPYVNLPEFPAVQQERLKKAPKIAASINRLNISVLLGASSSVLASLISFMDKKDAEELYSWLSVLTPDFEFDDVLAQKWFTVSHNLSKNSIGHAVSGFFKLAQRHNWEEMHLDFTQSLACLYKVLKSQGTNSKNAAGLLFNVAEQFPHRFAFVCVRIVSGGDKAVRAAEDLLLRVKELQLNKEESTLILDFTLETGWLLNKQDYEQVWKLISRKGSRILGQLNGGLVPMSSVRFLAGVLRGIETVKGMDAFISGDRIREAGRLFNVSSKKAVSGIFSDYPRLKQEIDRQMLLDLTVETISHRIAESDHSQLGFSVIIFLEEVLGGVTLKKFLAFLRAMGDELSVEALKFIKKIVTETSGEKKLSSINFMHFSGVVAKVFSVCTMQDRTAIRAFYRTLVNMDNSDSTRALLQLKYALESDIGNSSILSATSLILRASTEKNVKEFISRIEVTGRLIDTLSSYDRESVLSALVPAWVEILLSVDLETEEKVVGFLKKIDDEQNRKRYLDKVVTGLLGDLSPENPVFEDCLAFAVNGYNSSGLTEKRREVEYEVFKKVFRAGGRVKMVDGLMVDLLAMPGLEEEKTEQLISGIRSICNRFSRLAVWEDGGEHLFNEFMVHGVGNLLRSFVDNPASLEFVTSETIELLLNKLIHDKSSSVSASGIVNPGGTAQTFFGSILPGAIILFGRDARALPPFLHEIAEEFSRSVGGMAAGVDFAEYLVNKMNFEIQQDFVAVLDSWLTQKSPPPLQILPNWSNSRREEWNTLKIREDASRMKLFGAVSALSGASENRRRDAVLKTAGFLSRQLGRAGIAGTSGLSLKWNRTMVHQLATLSGDTPPLELFREGESLRKADPSLFSYLESIDGYMEQDVFHAWRQAALPPLLNCAVELVLVSGNSLDIAMKMVETATDAVEFLGYDSASRFLSTLQESIRHAKDPKNALVLIEKNFLLPLWRRNSSERLNSFLLGMEENKLLADILNERLLLEEAVSEKVRFMKNYASLFITAEKALLDIKSDLKKSKIADGLMNSWVFSGTGNKSEEPATEISETAEMVRDVFRRVKYDSGIVSASEAGEISVDMRRKYRDNADSVAIILRWTVDPAREGLLQLLEESQMLLQAAGTDAELMRLLDLHGAGNDFLEDARPYSENPAELKKFLMSLPKKSAQD